MNEKQIIAWNERKISEKELVLEFYREHQITYNIVYVWMQTKISDVSVE